MIHIVYRTPRQEGGKFDPFDGVLMVHGPQPDGWGHGGVIDLQELPEAQAPVYFALASSIQGKGGDWRATQVWARMMGQDKVSLQVEARQDGTGAVRTFTPADDSAFMVSSPAAVAFFRYFTGGGAE